MGENSDIGYLEFKIDRCRFPEGWELRLEPHRMK